MGGVKRTANRVLCACMSIVLAMGLVPFPAYGDSIAGSSPVLTSAPASDVQTEGEFTYRYVKDSGDICTLVGYSGSAASLDIPSQLGSSKVVSIGDSALEGKTALVSVAIPSSVTEIGSRAFADCTNLASVTLPASLTTIAGGAFEGDVALTEIDLPARITNADSPFMGCTGLAKASIAEGARTVPGGLFNGCSGLESIMLPSTLSNIGYRAFYGCEALGSVAIPESVREIGSEAFANCTSLSTVQLPDGLYRLDSWAFRGDTGITSVDIPRNLWDCNPTWTDVSGVPGASASTGPFYECSNLSTVRFSPTATYIPGYLLAGCSGITSIALPDSVTSIGSGAFAWCRNLTSIQLPAGLSTIGDSAFQGSGLSAIALPEKAEIGSEAFSDCALLSSVIFSGPVYRIGTSAFENCTSLTQLAFPKVSELGEKVCAGCTSLQKVSLPGGPTTLSAEAFYGCTALAAAEIPSSVTTIGSNAFGGCTALTGISVPEGVASVEYAAFAGCSQLSTVTLPSTLVKLGSIVFRDCDSLENITLPQGLEGLGNQAFRDCDQLKAVVIPNSLTSLGSQAFDGCTQLSSVKLGMGVSSILSGCFQNCPALASIAIPATVTEIAADAFASSTAISGATGSRAETYAEECGLTFNAVDHTPTAATVTPSAITLLPKQTYLLEGAVEPSDYLGAVAWASSDDGIVTVASNGKLRAVDVGKAQVTFTAGAQSTTCEVTVHQAVTGVWLNESWLFPLDGGESYQLKATVLPENASDRTVTWTSTDDAVARVDETGLVTARGNGTAVIRATANDGSGCYAECEVSVRGGQIEVETVEDLESPHDYSESYSATWKYTQAGAAGLVLTFDDRTNLGGEEDDFDGRLRVYSDFYGESFYGSQLAGKTVTVPGDTVYLRLYGGETPGWGFKVTSVAQAQVATIPAANQDLVYNGETQEGVPAGEGYTRSGTYEAIDSCYEDGDYEAVLTSNPGWIWDNGTVGKIYIDWYIAPAEYDLSGVEFNDLTVTYDGKPHSLVATGVPEGVRVYYDESDLEEVGTYTYGVELDCEDRNHSGSRYLTATLTIKPAPSTFTVDGSTADSTLALAAGNAAELPVVHVGDGEVRVLANGGATAWADYDAGSGKLVVRGYQPGTAQIRVGVVGAHNYAQPDPITLNVTVTQPGGGDPNDPDSPTVTKKSLAGAIMTGLPASVTYTGSNIAPAFTLTYGPNELVVGRDYFPLYSNNVSAGTVYVAAFGIGDYSGWLHSTFQIERADINLAAMSIAPTVSYTGSAVRPAVSLAYNDLTLEEGVDYELEYGNNVSVGTATATVKGIGNFLSTMSADFEIVDLTPAPQPDGGSGSSSGSGVGTGSAWDRDQVPVPGALVEKIDLAKGEVTFPQAKFTYNGRPQAPDPATVMLDGAPVPDDCIVSFQNASSTDVGTYRVTVEAAVDSQMRQGTATGEYVIEPADLTSATIELSAATFTADGVVHRPDVTGVTIGEDAIPSADYAIAFENERSSASGTYRVTVAPLTGNLTGEAIAEYTIDAAPVPVPVPVPKPAPAVKPSIKNATVDVKVSAKTNAATVKRATVKAGSAVTLNTVKVGKKTYKITAIAAKALKGTKAKSITIGNNVTTIGSQAFASASNLKTFTIGKSVKSIGKNVLKGSKALRTITVKSGSLTKTACKNLVKGTNVKTVKLSGKAAKSMRSQYAKWFPKSITLKP